MAPIIRVHGASDAVASYALYASDGLPAGAVAIPIATLTQPGVNSTVLVLPPTVGAPADAPAAGTARFDVAAFRLYIYTGSAWKSVLLA